MTAADRAAVMRLVVEVQEADYMAKMAVGDREVEVNTRVAEEGIRPAVAQTGHSERTCSCRVDR